MAAFLSRRHLSTARPRRFRVKPPTLAQHDLEAFGFQTIGQTTISHLQSPPSRRIATKFVEAGVDTGGPSSLRVRRARIQNFRSILDTGWFDLEPMTALVGINESGKTNILLALASLTSGAPYDPDVDAPRILDRDPSPDAPVVTVEFELDPEDEELLRQADYDAAKNARLRITKRWNGSLQWELPDIAAKRRRALDAVKADELIQRLNSVRSKVRKYGDRAGLDTKGLDRRRPRSNSPANFEKYVRDQLDEMRRVIPKLGVSETRREKLVLDLEAVERALEDCFIYPPPAKSPEQVLKKRVPVFRYFSDFSEVSGRVNLETYIKYQEDPESVTEELLDAEDQSPRFETISNLFSLLGLDPQEVLKASLSARQRIQDRISRQAKNVICPGWTQDIKLDIRFDGKHAMIMVADIIDGEQQAITELRQRSRGFKTFLSLFVNCGKYFTENAEPTVLLLDEPGLHLHADQQHELLEVLKNASEHTTIVYTSHSPWMLPGRALFTIKAVEKHANEGTVIRESWWRSESGTAIAIRKAIGITRSYDLAFPGKRYAIAVEGPSDYIYLNWALEAVADQSKPSVLGITELAIHMAEGAARLPEQIALLHSVGFESIVMLVDSDKAGRMAERDVLQKDLLEPERIVRLSDVLGDPNKEVNIEDFLDTGDLVRAVNAVLAMPQTGRRITITKKEISDTKKALGVTQAWRAVESILEQQRVKKGLVTKVEVAKAFYNLWKENEKSISDATKQRFRKLLVAIETALSREPE